MKITKSMKRTNPDRQRRQREALVRQEASSKLSPAEKLAVLDGGDYEAKKERAKLNTLLRKEKKQD